MYNNLCGMVFRKGFLEGLKTKTVNVLGLKKEKGNSQSSLSSEVALSYSCLIRDMSK